MSRTDTSARASSLPRRLLRGVLILAALLLVAWVGGQLMLASQMASETRYTVAAGLAALIVIVLAVGSGGGRR